MTTGLRCAGLTLLACLGQGGEARAQVQLGTIEVDAARASDRPDRPGDDDPATVIEAQTSAGAASVADLLRPSAGLLVRSRGGVGAPAAVSLRGAEVNDVAVFLDGVPLARAASGALDLSLLPAASIDHIEIWRGVPPPELSGEAVGGAINLVTRRGARRPSWRAAAGAGSFGARAASLGYGGAERGLRYDLTAGYHGATGDFVYYDANGTLLEAGDDHPATRQNNGFDQLSLDGSVERRLGRLRVGLAGRGAWKRQGVPGLGSSGGETRRARLDTGRALLDATLSRTGRRVDVRARAYLGYERIAYQNPAGEAAGGFGPGVSEGEAITAGATARADVPLGGLQLLGALAEARVEHRRPHDLLRPTRSGAPSTRALFALVLHDELRLASDRVALGPAIRLDGALAALRLDERGTPFPGQETARAYVSPRLTARWAVAGWLLLRGGAGRFIRFPTLLEQFGDGAFLLGRPTLLPESAWGGDAGARLRLRGRRARLELEGTFFGRRVEQAIAYVAAQNATAAVNVGDTEALGAEARIEGALQLRGARAGIAVDYTFVATRNLTDEPGARDKPLPGRPRHQLSARVDLGARPFALFYDLVWTDDLFRDPQGYNRIPGRVLHGVGGSLTHGRFRFSVEVRNLADLRVLDLPLGGSIHAGETRPYPLVDFFDYPLPGRAVYATLELSPAL